MLFIEQIIFAISALTPHERILIQKKPLFVSIADSLQYCQRANNNRPYFLTLSLQSCIVMCSYTELYKRVLMGQIAES